MMRHLPSRDRLGSRLPIVFSSQLLQRCHMPPLKSFSNSFSKSCLFSISSAIVFTSW